MDLLAPDSDSSDNESDKESQNVAVKLKPIDRMALNSAPIVTMTHRSTASAIKVVTLAGAGRNGDEVLMNNPRNSILCQPMQGPASMDPSVVSKEIQTHTPQREIGFDRATFDEQRTSFQRTGTAVAPEGQEIFRTTYGYHTNRLEKFAAEDVVRRKRPRPNPKQKQTEDDLVQGSDDEMVYGIWAPPGREEQWNADNQLSDVQKFGEDSLHPEQKAERDYLKERARIKGKIEERKDDTPVFERMLERKMAHLLPPKAATEPKEASTTFHGDEEFDYKGRSWIAPPAGLGATDVDVDHHKCFVPKKCVFRFTGHTKGVHRIRLFPRTGHLILSAGLDNTCKVWSVADKKLMRTYDGHWAAVRDAQFNASGSKFVSASFDRYLRLWDTESGKVLNTFSNKKVPYVVKFYPHDDNLFVVGCSDNKIVTYDATTGEITQEYNHHLAAVNAILFVEDNGTKMVTSSDDKKILVWEWDIGVPIKYISDPALYAMPCLVMHPALQFFVGQSLDNSITVFQAGRKFALQRKKRYGGHNVAGYACEMDFSTDGQFMVSGDGTGNLFFWDWKKHKILQKYRAHSSGPAICCAWHPLEKSTLFTCGWDGVIKMWH